MASKHTGEATLGNGRYELREPIAIGDMATIYKAWDTRVERIVAVKELSSLAKTDRRAIERFRREAHAAARLSHPNAVTIYDFLEEYGECYLIMEFVEGVNLKQYLAQKGMLSPQEAVQITSQMCAVLQVVHDYGFIHCDIKPQNIMITPDGQAKLTDSSTVYMIEAAGRTNTSILPGTADYFSPEQARGNPLSPASDIYSLGVVLYEMLAGRPPFVGPSVDVIWQHANNIPPPPSKYNPRIPRALELIIKRTFQKEPERRYGSAEAMRKALLESLQKSAEEVFHPSPASLQAMPTHQLPIEARLQPPRAPAPPPVASGIPIESAATPKNAQPRVFVSHSHKNDEFTAQFVEDLRRAGVEVWVDMTNIQHGSFMARIDEALKTYEWLVLILTPDALASSFVKMEVEAAIIRVKHNRMKDFIPFMALPCDPDAIPATWETFHRYDATNDYKSALAGLLRALGIA